MAVKKTWYEIISPSMFGSVSIGETMAFEPKNLIGRKIKVNITELGKQYQKFFMKLIFKIDNIEGSKAHTNFVGHEVTTERIYRMVQRRVRRVDCIVDTKTSDNVKIRLKVILILVRRVGTSVKNDARAKAKESVERLVKDMTLEALVKSMIEDQLQKNIREECKKIYPVGQIEVRKSEVM